MDVAGRYRLLEVIGRGGHAVVWRAWDEELGVAQAVKIIEAPSQYRQLLQSRLEAEAMAMAQLRHPNVLRVTKQGEVADKDYLVMDLAEGGSLADRLSEGGPLSPHLAACYAVQVLSALGAAHRIGIVHRDVKPQNVLRDRHQVALLADFGVALLPSPEALRSTGTGVFLGSIAYMAPEQRLDPRRVGPTADIYGAAATLYAILTDANPVDLFTATPDSPRWAGIPPALATILQRATALEPSARHPSAVAFAREIADVLPHLPGAEDTPDAVARATDYALALLFEDESTEGTAPTPARPLPTRSWHAPTIAETPSIDDAAAYTLPLETPAPEEKRRWIPWAAAGGALLLVVVGVLVLGPAVSPPPAQEAPPLEPLLDPGTWEAVVAPEAAEPVEATSPAPIPPEPVRASAEPRAQEKELPATPPVDPTPDMPASADATGGSGAPLGTWSGSFGGRPATLLLAGSSESLTGTLEVRFQDRVQASRVRGHLDPADGSIVLEDEDRSRPDAGIYTARLAADRNRLSGTFQTFAGGRVTGFSLSTHP
ncbi:MAG: protein kinase [Deltaproteobacteria bacterium]|nr:protein kinase [Deltaproteobacteria bacterium]